MSVPLRTTRPLAPGVLPIPKVVRRARPMSTTPLRAATQGYGDSGPSKWQQETPISSETRNREHPGPPPPSNATSKAQGAKNPEDASANSGGSRSKDAKEKGSSPTGGRLRNNPSLGTIQE